MQYLHLTFRVLTRNHQRNSTREIFYILSTVHLDVILVNDQHDALFLNVFISTPLHVSSNKCSSSGGPNCINTSPGITHSGGWRSDGPGRRCFEQQVLIIRRTNLYQYITWHNTLWWVAVWWDGQEMFRATSAHHQEDQFVSIHYLA